MTDWIKVQNLRLRGNHGVFEREKQTGQEFQFDIDCAFDTRACAQSDDYEQALCYASLCDLARQVCGDGPFDLVETLANRLADLILEKNPSVTETRIAVRKPTAPMKGTFDAVGVQISRKRRWRVGLSLGSNIGDAAANLHLALSHLTIEDGFELDQVSSFYKTPPWGDENQDPFVNACVTGWSTLAPESLLRRIKQIELSMGRAPERRWGPRLIDIDLLFADDWTVDTPLLTLPHREMFNRPFVLIPLAEIAGDQVVKGQRVGDAAKAQDATGIDRIDV